MNKPIEDFKTRFNTALSIREIKPADLAEKSGLSKSTISHYMSGYTKPKSDKLFILAKALSINEAWLMGYDVPMERPNDAEYTEYANINTIAFEITGRSLQYSPQIYDAICKSLDSILADRNDKKINTSHGQLNIYNILKESNVSYDDKAMAIRSIIDMALLDSAKNKISFFYTLDREPFEIQLDRLIYMVKKLNMIGLNKVIDYATDLSNMNNYSQNINEEKITHLPSAPGKAYLEPQAAHERTDIEVTDEMRKHDDDIMDNDDFWK